MISKIPDSEYFSILEANQSGLSAIDETCEAKFKWGFDNPKEPTPQMILGSAVHCLLLEPKEFNSRFVVKPDVDGRTTVGKEAMAAFNAALSKNTRVLDRETMEKAYGMAEAVMKTEASLFIPSDGDSIEQTMRWVDDLTQCPCKAKLDILLRGVNFIVDLKTTKCASKKAFESSILNFNYHRQFGHYRSGARHHGFDPEIWIVAIESEAPYLSVPYRMQNETLNEGYIELLPLYRRFKDAIDSGNWCGYKPDDIGLPAYYMRRKSFE